MKIEMILAEKTLLDMLNTLFHQKTVITDQQQDWEAVFDEAIAQVVIAYWLQRFSRSQSTKRTDVAGEKLNIRSLWTMHTIKGYRMSLVSFFRKDNIPMVILPEVSGPSRNHDMHQHHSCCKPNIGARVGPHWRPILQCREK